MTLGESASLRHLHPQSIRRYQPRPQEMHEVVQLLRRIGHTDLLRPPGVDKLQEVARSVPPDLKREIHSVRNGRSGVLVLSLKDCLPEPPRTPRHWKDVCNGQLAPQYDSLLVLLCSVLGEVFRWSTQQDGRLVHDALPIRGHEYEQLGTSSMVDLNWHTEDAFHEHRADYVGLLCVRNVDCVATSVCCADWLEISRADAEVLRSPRYVIRPDNSHLPRYNSTDIDTTSFGEIAALKESPSRVAVLFGSHQSPRIRVDRDFVTPVDGDDDASAALGRLNRNIERNLVDVRLKAGELCILDNHRVVHGRRAFSPRYDGTDRWIKQCNTRALVLRGHDTVTGL